MIIEGLAERLGRIKKPLAVGGGLTAAGLAIVYGLSNYSAPLGQNNPEVSVLALSQNACAYQRKPQVVTHGFPELKEQAHSISGGPRLDMFHGYGVGAIDVATNSYDLHASPDATSPSVLMVQRNFSSTSVGGAPAHPEYPAVLKGEFKITGIIDRVQTTGRQTACVLNVQSASPIPELS